MIIFSYYKVILATIWRIGIGVISTRMEVSRVIRKLLHNAMYVWWCIKQSCGPGVSSRRADSKYILKLRPIIHDDVVGEGTTRIKDDSYESGLRNWLCSTNLMRLKKMEKENIWWNEVKVKNSVLTMLRCKWKIKIEILNDRIWV